MSSMEDDPPSPEFGGHPTTPLRAPWQQSSTKLSESRGQDEEEDEDEDEEEEELVSKKKRTLKRDTRE